MKEKITNSVLGNAKSNLDLFIENTLNFLRNYKVQNYVLYVVNILTVLVTAYLMPLYVSFKLIMIIVVIDYICIKEYKNTTDKSLNKEKLNERLYLVIFSFSYLLISWITYFFENKFLILYEIKNFCNDDLVKLNVLIISGFFFLLNIFLSAIISNIFSSYCIEYDFSINNIIANKNYFRLKVWNYIMYKDLNGESSNEENNNIILEREIINRNRILIDNDEHEEFKNKLKSMKRECLEKFLFYDQLPTFKNSTSFKLIDEVTKPEGISSYVLALFTILLPILLENSFSSIVCFFNSLSKPVLLLVICIIFILTLSAWNFYKIFKFVDKRKQIDSFFFNDIKEALEIMEDGSE